MILLHNYTVYKHTNINNGKVYIGITKQKPERRWQNGIGYKSQPYFYNAIALYGWENFRHDILFIELSKEEAEKKEIELICKYDSTNNVKGYNLSKGGNEIGKHTEETREKMSKSAMGRSGWKHTPEALKKISDAGMGRPHTEQSKEKLRISHLSKKSVAAKPLLQMDSDGNIIKKWDCTMDVQRQLGYANTFISACCLGKYQLAYGYKWKYCNA